jgi:lysophospholipase L1-like esterase
VLSAVVVLLAQAASTAAPAASPTPTLPPMDCPEVARAIEQMMRQDARLRDWPQLARYRSENAALPAPAPGEPRVVFMGDSITDNWARHAPFFPGKPYVNRGISGQTTPQMLVRFRPDVVALQPKAVVILAGTNDIGGNTGPMSNEEIQANLASMADLAATHGIRVVLASILPVHDLRVVPPGDVQPRMTVRRPPARIAAVNDWMKLFAAEKGHVYLDYFQATVDEAGRLRKELSEDGLHPNTRGYEVMAPLAEKAIAAALAPAKP